jgi:glycosyltransferase involved in cell wall biosynthesis
MNHGAPHSMSKVDVIVVTYNHEPYIGRALESVFCQNSEHIFRVVVSDDSSTDATVRIAQRTARNFPDVECVILKEAKNVGITKNYQRAFSACHSEYVAVLEGDDYWCSRWKLTKQIRFLDDHWECSMCASNFYVFNERARSFKLWRNETDGDARYDSRSLILDNVIGNFSTCVYRRDAIRAIPKAIFDIKAYEWAINICAGDQGLLGFLNEPLSVYRLHERGSWSQLSAMQQTKEVIALIPLYNELTSGRYRAEFDQFMLKLEQLRVGLGESGDGF